MPRPPSVPRPYVKAGQLVVILRDPRTGYRKTEYLGDPEDAASRRRYAEVIAEWEAGDRVVTLPTSRVRRKIHRPASVTVAEVVLGYFKSVKPRHTDTDGKLTGHGQVIRASMRFLREEAGHHAAREFGPKTLRSVRDAMIASRRFNRDTINKLIRYQQSAFKWALAEELIPAGLYDALRALEPLKRGEITEVRESVAVAPVSDAVVDATLPHLPGPLRGLVEIMRLSGARCGELTALRPIDIDTTGPIWRAELRQHKNAHRGLARVLLFGPRCQRLIEPFLQRDVTAYLFCPAETVAELHERRHRERKTPPGQGNGPKTNRKPKPSRSPSKRYSTASVSQAIGRACKRAFPAPDGLPGAD